ncbi:LiaF transmembrane domain-containing protein [Halalkalibacterium halodurans]|uniref:LiaF transmembrane domain-containing protein n=1 Tax=Halalkalibacterium halodurans TaxID=86665 RepID=A0A0M0KMW4_ALKHA|nr:hypothetical protein [Halalkalibacterium halodurans]TPE68747.1 hypothetical protein AMD02_011800 [Halalkalibacterium halodurans]
MKGAGKWIFGILLVIIGANMILGMFNIHLGGIIGLVLGALLLYWGYQQWQARGKLSFGSVLLLAFGSILVMGGLGGVIGLAVAILFIYFGYRLLKKSDNDEEQPMDVALEKRPTSRAYDSIDEEFNKMMKKYDEA